jgi:spermidine synthase
MRLPCVLPFICGVLTGAQFPLAGKLREDESPRSIASAGTLYAADLLGGWLGGLLGGVFLLPVLGLTATALTVAFLKLLTLLLYLSSTSGRARA